MITVESLRPTELSEFVQLAKRLHSSSEWSWVPFSAAAMRKSTIAMIKRPDYCVLVSREAGEMKGLLIGSVDSVIYGRTRVVTDIEFVAEKGGDQLFDAFLAWGRSVGAKCAVNGVSNSGREKAKDRFFSKHGAERTGGVYITRLDQ